MRNIQAFPGPSQGEQTSVPQRAAQARWPHPRVSLPTKAPGRGKPQPGQAFRLAVCRSLALGCAAPHWLFHSGLTGSPAQSFGSIPAQGCMARLPGPAAALGVLSQLRAPVGRGPCTHVASFDAHGLDALGRVSLLASLLQHARSASGVTGSHTAPSAAFCSWLNAAALGPAAPEHFAFGIRSRSVLLPLRQPVPRATRASSERRYACGDTKRLHQPAPRTHGERQGQALSTSRSPALRAAPPSGAVELASVGFKLAAS